MFILLLSMPRGKKEPVERITIKLPKSVAAYFRKAFPHGRRSEFVEECIANYKHTQEVSLMEEGLRKAAKHRQS